ncbi:hypothetical protein C1645_762752 [Glomus cerebriforme]|uniref:Uncharacterized protein n=1 Tax=Glomus cerebriforme TaxID=658196 RepID=A0A397TA71_9GLOM|nr:hypothetical protein C1645_762752 [Glomus cerebriforme]
MNHNFSNPNDIGFDMTGFFYNYSNGFQQQLTDDNNQFYCNTTLTPLPVMINNDIFQAPLVNAFNTVNATSLQDSSYTPQYVNCNTNGLSHPVNSSNMSLNSPQSQVNQCDVFRNSWI